VVDLRYKNLNTWLAAASKFKDLLPVGRLDIGSKDEDISKSIKDFSQTNFPDLSTWLKMSELIKKDNECISRDKDKKK